MSSPERALPSSAVSGAALSWETLIQRLWNERNSLVRDFLGRFDTISYNGAVVPEDDVYTTAVDTMDRFLYQMVDAELPPELVHLPREVAGRRCAQGVALHSFLEAVRHDFRVLWKGLERVAGPEGVPLLMANMDRVLDTVERYVSDIQQAFLEEEALQARDRQLYRQRLITRLFSSEAVDLHETARGLGLRPDERFELLAVTGPDLPAAQRLAVSAQGVFAWEQGAVLYLFRPRRAGQTWAEQPPSLSAGYVPDAGTLAGLPASAASARVLAAAADGGLCTVDSAWLGLARGHLEEAFPGFAGRARHALAGCTAHERERLLEAAATYARTGSIKATAEELYCHRNTVVNRLHALQELIGLNLTVPLQAARALVMLADEPAFRRALLVKTPKAPTKDG